MKSVISWNVNGIRAAEKKDFLGWLNTENPDVLCIQETKACKEQLSDALLAPNLAHGKYYTYWASAEKKGYSGTAIYTKEKPLNVRTMGVKEFDCEGRVIVADYDDFSVISAYFPNSQAEGKRLGYKLEFCDAMLEFCNSLRKENRNFILSGDYNIAHKEIDLANPKGNEKNPGFLPEERTWMDKFTSEPFVDTFRHFCKDPEHYTWWSYRTRARDRNIGWRIDYHCVNEEFMPKIQSSTILSDVMGSDHCPIKIITE